MKKKINETSHVMKYVFHQLNSLFPANKTDYKPSVKVFKVALEKTKYCLSQLKDYRSDFSVFISYHYTIFLYFLSHEVGAICSQTNCAAKIYILNKALNGIDMFYEIKMPDVFAIGHSVGAVFSKATYGRKCVFHQGCVVGQNWGDRPVLEDGVIMYPHSAIIGKCVVRKNSVLAPGVQLVNMDTPGNCYVFSGPNSLPVFKKLDEFYADRFFLKEK